MKHQNIFLAAFTICILSQSAYATKPSYGFMSQRYVVAAQLFDINMGLGEKSMLAQVEDLVSGVGTLTYEQNEAVKSMFCGPNAVVEALRKFNLKIEGLSGTDKVVVAIKDSYQMNEIANTILPMNVYCEDQNGKVSIQETIAKTRAQKVKEEKFAQDFIKALGN